MATCDERKSPAVGVCALTSLDRDSWADARERLIALSDDNAENLRVIERGYHVLALDDDEYPAVRDGSVYVCC